MAVFVKIFDGTQMCCNLQDVNHGLECLMKKICEEKKYPKQDLQFYYNGRLVQEDERLQENGTYHVTLALRGGKGGFGAMLRMIGAQIEKTTNHEACRDLSGRRMRDVNNEKKLQSWIEKKQQQEEERQKKRRDKLERMRSTPKHYFVDPSYDQQREAVTDSLDEAVTTGIDVAGSSKSEASSSGGVKRKTDTDSDEDDDDADEAEFKKHCMWLGIEGGEEEDDDMEDDKKGEDISENTSAPSTSTSSSSSASPIEGESGAKTPTGEENAETATETTSSGFKTLLSSLPPPRMGTSSSTTTEEVPINLDDYSSVEDLEELGLDRLKSALMERGMKCGGTLQERAQRLYSVRGLEPSEIDPSLLSKGAKGKKGKKK
ncbi:replication stress response regulator SDE2 [Strongylocentrotus purpuratus]|uniref:Replication stress response regulator SDE2 n=1 Tax=Strongylocentrotus purpuratus TaxID=7668 RepID=A0A7M7G075_STRPU|nr:replication stress response regulator SDE2 [Strongylocentrotus purpuratus]|eukprot:XP_001197540.1 PREDICTED: protein SDE2 homolog [Strongylocentrotus purpuratus]